MYYNFGQGQVFGGTMSADMKTVLGEFPVLDTSTKEAWQVSVVQEGPIVFQRGSKLYMLISGHHTLVVGGYAVFCATAPGPRGPWTRQPNNPVMCGICKNKGLVETGHCSAVQTPSGKWYMLYHAVTGDRPGVRALCVDEIVFQGDLLTVPGGAIREPRPYPS